MRKLVVAMVLAVGAFAAPDLFSYQHNLDYHNRTSLNCRQEQMGAVSVIKETPTHSTVLFEGNVIAVNGVDETMVEVGGFPLTFCSFR